MICGLPGRISGPTPPDAKAPEVAAPAPLEEFLRTMRGDVTEPKIRVR